MKKKTLGSFPIFELLAQQTLFNSPNSVSVIKKKFNPLHNSPVGSYLESRLTLIVQLGVI